ncbi:aminoimidazole riboside kinase [Vibrio paucivorans]|uniref:Aminoimidazole riboside kinase n=1 Tax=Vibrio paucivorans TaxID=2829489 RepID=A0A9X3HTJ7_9VIBR|nr:aminoimidazole riboside kinase [Vibrio paucivorans]MCW8335890.1 aminoimidazole riboside kinase [Vibrio paucivorans]
MNKVWVTGDAVVDLIPLDDSSYLKCPGGAPANVAVAIAHLKGDAAFFGRVGQDPLGRFMKETLKTEGVCTDKMLLDDEQRTSTVIVDLDDTGERSFTFMVKPSADQFFAEQDIPEFSANQWMHSCSIALANEPSRGATFEAMKRIKAAGGYVSFDPNLRDEVWPNQSEIKPTVMKAVELADVVKFSEEELLFLTDTSELEQALAMFEKQTNKLVLITLGSEGALALFGGKRKLISGSKIDKVIDTTGAGDAFVGGLLAKLSQNQLWRSWDDIEAAIRWGNGCGALATTQKGAMTTLPSVDELLELLSK